MPRASNSEDSVRGNERGANGTVNGNRRNKTNTRTYRNVSRDIDRIELGESYYESDLQNETKINKTGSKKSKKVTTKTRRWISCALAGVVLALMIISSYRTFHAYRVTRWQMVRFEPGSSNFILFPKYMQNFCGAVQLACKSGWSVALQPYYSRLHSNSVPPCVASQIKEEGFYSFSDDTFVFHRGYQLAAGSIWHYSINPASGSNTQIMILRLRERDFDASSGNPRQLVEKSLDTKVMVGGSASSITSIWHIFDEGRYVLAIVQTQKNRKNKIRHAQGAFSFTIKRSSHCPPNDLPTIESADDTISSSIPQCYDRGQFTPWYELSKNTKGMVFTAKDYSTEEGMLEAGILGGGERSLDEYWRCRGKQEFRGVV